MKFYYLLARNISYTFAITAITIISGWISLLFSYFLGVSFSIANTEKYTGILLKSLPWVLLFVSLLHCLQAGMLTPLKIPAFLKSHRLINKYFKGSLLNPDIDDENLLKVHSAITALPLHNLLSSIIYTVLFAVTAIIAVYFNLQKIGIFEIEEFKYFLRLVGIGVLVVWIIYGISTYLLTDILTGYERASCFNELLNRNISSAPKYITGIRLKLSFFIVLMMLTLLIFAAMVEKSRFYPELNIKQILLYFIFAIGAGIFIMFLNTSSVLRILNEMIRVSKAISSGSEAKFKILSLDKEMAQIEFALIEMSHEIAEHRKNLESKVEQRTLELQSALLDLKEKDDLIQKQLDIASTIQRGILPGKVDDWNELKFSIRYIAMEKIGGDFYDVFQLKGDKLGLLVADVSGHGIPAALVTTMAKISFGNACLKSDSPRRIFQDVNQNILEHVKTQDYLTCFFIAIDDEYNITYSNASHQKAMLLRTEEKKIELLDTNGLFIGAVEEAKDTYEEKTTRLRYNDRLILYTDGIPEAVNESREEYSTNRLQEVILKNQYLPLEDFSNSIIEDVQMFIGNTQVEDDITLVVIELIRDEAIDIIKSAKKLAHDNKIDEAIDYLERGLRLYSENRKLLYNLAKYYFQVNDFKKTIGCIEKYISYDKRNKFAYYIGGAAYYQIRKYQNSIDLLEGAVRIDPNFINAHFALGMSYKNIGDQESAIKAFEKTVNLDSDNRIALHELAELRKTR